MENLKNIKLFNRLNDKEIEKLLHCFHTYTKEYEKDEIIYHSGDYVKYIGVVLKGSICIENNDIWGNKTILDVIGENEVFLENYALVSNEELMVDIVCKQKCKILFIDTKRSITTCSKNCYEHHVFIENLLHLSAMKNLNLSRHIFHTTPKSVRGRVLSYLSHMSKKKGSNVFDIPFNRQELAEYLLLDRSALSKELSQMKKEGIIDYKLNHFTLKK